MEINTSRFGPVEYETDAVLQFPWGLLGMQDCRQWIFVTEAKADALAWLQSAERPDTAIAVVSPRRFVPSYQMRVARRELAELELEDINNAGVLAIVGKRGERITLNLKAPLVINPQRRLGRQVVTNGDLPIRYELASEQTVLRRSA